MKNLSLILNVILIIAVAILFYLHFSKDTNSGSGEQAKSDDTVEVTAPVKLPEIRSVNGAIAFVNLDSLRTKYQMYKDGQNMLEAEYTRKEKEFQDKAAAYQQEVQNYYQLAPSLDEATRAKREGELRKKGEDIAMLEQRLTGELDRQQENFNKKLFQNLEEYLGELSREKNYSYILTYSKGNPATIVYANDSLNITSAVISGLNKAYKTKKK